MMMPITNFPLKIKIVDTSSTLLSHDILFPFAFDEVYGREVGMDRSEPIIHIWRHPKAFIMGLRDRKLPNALETMQWLEQQGYSVTVRNSGGAAVPLDPGVVNISIILPNLKGGMEFRQDFELMYQLICESLKSEIGLVNKGEVKGAYCPGDFDLSIKGKKFCGIAQRRQTKAVVVQAFVLVEGRGKKRGAIVREFYERASNSSTLGYPIVKPYSMSSLSEMTDISTSEMFVMFLKEYLKSYGEIEEIKEYDPIYNDEIQKTIFELRNRYENRER